MAKVVSWTPEEAKKILAQRLLDAKAQRQKSVEKDWRRNEQTVFNTNGEPLGEGLDTSLVNLTEQDTDIINNEAAGATNYTFKNLRYIHSQLSANPPSIIPRPTSNDPDDRRKADAADRVVRYAMKKYRLQSKIDRTTLNALLYGAGLIKVQWNPEKGEILEVNEETGEITMQGDIDINIPNVWNLYIDPDADCWEDVRFIFEEIFIPWDEACYRWPDKKEILKKYKVSKDEDIYNGQGTSSSLRSSKYDVIALYEYWEKGLPSNGLAGRYTVCGKDGDVIVPVTMNPERYAPPSKTKRGELAKYEIAVLPYHLLTDIDVPNSVWGKSFVEYAAGLQDDLNQINSMTLQNARAHGVARIILPEGSEIAPDSITNSPWDMIKYTGTQPPNFMEPMPLPPVMPQLMEMKKAGINDTAGTNESMFGQQSREQSGFSMQYATNQGNMIRYRLLNKYRDLVEEVYSAILRIIQNKWDLPRTIAVIGKEKAFEARDIKGADLIGGYDLLADYGASLSLDPTTRREEMMSLMPLFEKAGVEPRTLLKMLKLNELSGQYDTLELASDRQREIFEEMTVTGKYISPEELQDHKNMLSYAYIYVMTSEFKYLHSGAKLLITKHIKDRETMAAQPPSQVQQGGMPGPEAAGGMPPLPGLGALQAPPLP